MSENTNARTNIDPNDTTLEVVQIGREPATCSGPAIHKPIVMGQAEEYLREAFPPQDAVDAGIMPPSPEPVTGSASRFLTELASALEHEAADYDEGGRTEFVTHVRKSRLLAVLRERGVVDPEKYDAAVSAYESAVLDRGKDLLKRLTATEITTLLAQLYDLCDQSDNPVADIVRGHIAQAQDEWLHADIHEAY